MDRYWKLHTADDAPAVPETNAGGFPVDDVPSSGVKGTVPGAWWYHCVTEEIRNAISRLGVTPDWTKTDQLGLAITDALSQAIDSAAHRWPTTRALRLSLHSKRQWRKRLRRAK
jgi:hypothetical protein